MSLFPLDYRPEVHEDLDKIPRNVQARIKKTIEERLGSAPDRYGERLRRSLLGLWKLRSGDYRIIYTLVENKVTVWMIGHRKEVYEEIEQRWIKHKR